jgi:hypothetical protein
VASDVFRRRCFLQPRLWPCPQLCLRCAYTTLANAECICQEHTHNGWHFLYNQMSFVCEANT